MRINDAQRELLLRFLDGRLGNVESQSVEELLQSSEEARTFLRDVAEQAVMVANIERMSSSQGEPVSSARVIASDTTSEKKTGLRVLLGVSAVLIFGLTGSLFYQSAKTERQLAANNRQPVLEDFIARVSGLSGPLIWRGDRGQVVKELTVGTQLAGGTIQGMAPDSWFELAFRDDSTVMIAGVSMLTFSDVGQKELYLNNGVLSANVVPQPAGQAMLVHTRTADLLVQGTRFNVETELNSTILHVSEGEVQLRRLSDGRTVNVPANHRVLTTADGVMSLELAAVAVNAWKSQLQQGQENTYVKWLPASHDGPSALRAIPFVPEHNKAVTLYLLGFPVRQVDNAPVVVQTDSRFILRGCLASSADVYLGIRVVRSNGEFAGKFLAGKPVKIIDGQRQFEAEFRLAEFGLDPCVWDRKDELPTKPDGLIMTCVWSFTHTGVSSGLGVTEVELIPSDSR